MDENTNKYLLYMLEKMYYIFPFRANNKSGQRAGLWWGLLYLLSDIGIKYPLTVELSS
jgi:hypothetical protein